MFVGSHKPRKDPPYYIAYLGTCKLHHINPTWLADVLTRISYNRKKDIGQLLPHNWISQQK
ncbi:transposase domain-containing protein [Chitinophaga sp. YR573]|uniref:transposase domain-containing protein n=1 Tax=Chitinophaga sp. YR573 TaxID=1881040 RepID=UPI003977E1D3